MTSASSFVAFGGLTKLTDQAIALRAIQIANGFRLHSCHDYGDALDVISKATSSNGPAPILTTKVYCNCFIPHRRLSVMNQLQRIVERLGVIPQNWHIQLCNNPMAALFQKGRFALFREQAEKEFGPLTFFLESHPLWEGNLSSIIETGQIDGVAVFDNGLTFGVSNRFRQMVAAQGLDLFAISPLGGGRQGLLQMVNHHAGLQAPIDQLLSNLDFKSITDFHIAYLKSHLLQRTTSYAVSAVQTVDQMDDLLVRLLVSRSMTIDQLSQLDRFKLQNQNPLHRADSYGQNLLSPAWHPKQITSRKRYLALRAIDRAKLMMGQQVTSW